MNWIEREIEKAYGDSLTTEEKKEKVQELIERRMLALVDDPSLDTVKYKGCDIDIGFKELIPLLNEYGFTTDACCTSHLFENWKYFYIRFCFTLKESYSKVTFLKYVFINLGIVFEEKIDKHTRRLLLTLRYDKNKSWDDCEKFISTLTERFKGAVKNEL